MERPAVEVDAGACTACAECIDACPTSALRTAGLAQLVSPVLCDACGKCVVVCRYGALRLTPREAPPFDPDAVRLRKEKLARLRALAGEGGAGGNKDG